MRMYRKTRRPPGELERATIRAEYLREPLLEFAGGRQHVDPKTGISRFGPKSLGQDDRHPASVRVGFIGTAQTIEATGAWFDRAADGMPGPPERPGFPGFRHDRGFRVRLEMSDRFNATLAASEVRELLQNRKSRSRFEQAVELLDGKLALLARKDLPPQYVVLALPDDVRAECRAVEYTDAEHGRVRRDLRRAFKAAAMQRGLPTQLMDEDTLGADPGSHPSEVAWNIFAAMYYKLGGQPWGPTGLRPGTCYVGIGFFRPLGAGDPNVRTALVQAFDEHGDGLILRGPDFEWDSRKQGTASPHLTAEDAAWTIRHTMRRYEEEMGQRPARLVVHKTSRYWEAERDGMLGAVREAGVNHDLLAVRPDDGLRLFPLNQYPPLRGTRYGVGDLDLIYTTGFEADLQQYRSSHVPTPLRVADHVGYDTSRRDLLAELLVLSKLNWNSTRIGALLPITLTFAKRVGDVLKECRRGEQPRANFKFYM